MILSKPEVQFVPIDLKIETSQAGQCGPTSSNPNTCDSGLYADVDLCSCYGNESQAVTPFSM